MPARGCVGAVYSNVGVCHSNAAGRKDTPPEIPNLKLAGPFGEILFRFGSATVGGRSVYTPAPSREIDMQDEGPAFSEAEQVSTPPEASFETRFEQFYLQLSEGKTGGMVVSVVTSCFFLFVLWSKTCACCDLCYAAGSTFRTHLTSNTKPDAAVQRGCVKSETRQTSPQIDNIPHRAAHRFHRTCSTKQGNRLEL